MDILQKYLAKREAESPSPTLLAEPPTMLESVKTAINSMTRRVKRVTEDVEKPDKIILQESRPYEERSVEYHEIIDAKRDLRLTLGDIGRISGATIISPKYVERKYHALKEAWERKGYSFDEEGRYHQSVMELSRVRAQKCIDGKLANTIDLANEGNLDYTGFQGAIDAIDFWEAQGVKPKINKEDILDAHKNSEAKIKLDSLPQGVYIAHMLSNGDRGSMNNNPLTTPAERQKGWEYFGDKALNIRPSISCVAFTADEPYSRRFFSSTGILIEDGIIHDASGNDVGSKAITEDVRLSIFERWGSVKERLERAIKYQPDKHREVIIGSKWTPRAVFYEKPLASKEEINKARALAQSHNIPLYEFKKEEGFSQVA